jgi:serine O-acetyltransferase
MNEELFLQTIRENNSKVVNFFPDKQEAEHFIHDLFHFLFVCHPLKRASTRQVKEKYDQLKNTFAALLFESDGDEKKVEDNNTLFFDQLPFIYEALRKDAAAILAFDPAAQSFEEVVVTYPGFFATAIYRLSHQMWEQGITILPRLFTEYAHSKTGIDIHPAAKIGESFSIDHGTGIVIGETSVIGNFVKIYQGVTLGALNVAKNNANSKRHPTIEDHVIIYSGATILGGTTTVGQGSIVGGNVWLTNSIPSNSVVYHKSELKVKDKDPFPEPLNFII